MLEMGWILAVYGIGILCVHLAHHIHEQRQPPFFFSLFNKRLRVKRIHHRLTAALHASTITDSDHRSYTTYVCIINQKYSQIEWLVRSLLFTSWLKGQPIEIYVLVENGQDESSDDPTDHTMKIVRKFADQELVHLLLAPKDREARAALEKLMKRSIVLELDEQKPFRAVFQ